MKKIINLIKLDDVAFNDLEKTSIVAGATMLAFGTAAANVLPSGWMFRVANALVLVYAIRYWLFRVMVRNRIIRPKALALSVFILHLPFILTLHYCVFKFRIDQINGVTKDHHEKSKQNNSKDAPKS